MNTLSQLLEKIKETPEIVDFKEVIAAIDTSYSFSPTAFKNGDTYNEAGQNNGSCKVFAFGKLNTLSKEQTLQLFGDYYRVDVLESPDGSDHQNIRNFISHGWEGIEFEGDALAAL